MDLAKLRAVFIGESEELLGRLEQALLEVEKNPSSADNLRTIFQVMHTLKGNAATMNFAKMAELAHRLEDVMQPFKDGKRAISSEWIDFLLKNLDTLRALLREFQEGKDMGIDIQPALDKLKELTEAEERGGGGADAPASQAKIATPGAAGQDVLPSPRPAPASAQPAPKPAQQQPASKPAPAPQGAPKARASAKGAHVPEEPHEPEGNVAVAAAADASGGQQAVRDNLDSIQKTTVRVQLRHLDNMMNLVGELAITKSRLIQYSQELGVSTLSAEMKFLERLSAQLQEEVLQTRMVPVVDIFQRYSRVVRDISHELKKEVSFVIQDNGISVDRVLLEKINEPIVHLLRNAIDHGIDSPEERKKEGKPANGIVSLVARHEKNFAVVEVMDDGRGINVARVKQKALDMGVISAEKASKMSDQEAVYLVCHPSLSTKEQVTKFSGRGVGMDVVQETMHGINGHLDIKTTPGMGTRFSLFLPLNLAIIQALLFKVGGQTFALPLADVLEIVSLELVKPRIMDRQEVITLRDEVLPLIRLAKTFRIESNAMGYAMVVQSRTSRFALVVDEMVGRQEVVLKNLTGFLKQIRCIGGATILGDGRAIFILDVQGFL